MSKTELVEFIAAKAGLTTAEMEALRASVEGTIYASSGLATTISSSS